MILVVKQITNSTTLPRFSPASLPLLSHHQHLARNVRLVGVYCTFWRLFSWSYAVSILVSMEDVWLGVKTRHLWGEPARICSLLLQQLAHWVVGYQTYGANALRVICKSRMKISAAPCGFWACCQAYLSHSSTILLLCPDLPKYAHIHAKSA